MRIEGKRIELAAGFAAGLGAPYEEVIAAARKGFASVLEPGDGIRIRNVPFGPYTADCFFWFLDGVLKTVRISINVFEYAKKNHVNTYNWGEWSAMVGGIYDILDAVLRKSLRGFFRTRIDRYSVYTNALAKVVLSADRECESVSIVIEEEETE